MTEKRNEATTTRYSQSSKPDGDSASEVQKGASPSSAKLTARIPSSEKGKWKTGHSSASSSQPWQHSSSVKSPSTLQQKDGELEEGEIPGGSSWCSDSSQEEWTEVKAPYWWRRDKQNSTTLAGVRHHTGSFSGTEKFKKLVYGKCFNCLAPDHHVKDCCSPTACWRCNKSGHQSHSCPRRTAPGYIRHLEGEKRVTQPPPHSAPAKISPVSLGTEGRSYLEAARGGSTSEAVAGQAAYPGDPRARPTTESVFITATGAIQRRRDALLGRAAVCWLDGNSHDSELEPRGGRAPVKARHDMGRFPDHQALPRAVPCHLQGRASPSARHSSAAT